MKIELLTYNKNENIVDLVKCCNNDKEILRNIPHQPCEFSNKPFKLTTTCNPQKQGDYYQYYTGSKQLATFENKIETPFTNIYIQKSINKILTRIKPPLSIHKQYKLDDINEEEHCTNKITYEKAFVFLLKGGLKWGEFIQDWLPYLFIVRQILKEDESIKIITKNHEFDSFNYFVKNILDLNNQIVVLDINKSIRVNEIYELHINGPFASGLFPYQGHCTCPIILYKKLYKYIQDKIPIILNHNKIKNDNINENQKEVNKELNKESKKKLIYTKRNTGNSRRNVSNEELVENILREYCKTNNLEYISFFYQNYKFEDRIRLFNEAAFVVGVHGSCNFHSIFCPPQTKIIEFICIKDCHSTQLVNLSYGLEYWQITIPDYGQFEYSVNVNQNSINSLREILNKGI
jgi:hypothetical protein